MASYDKKFRTRAIAIAAVGAVAVGGVQVTAPTGSVLAAPAASAQETGVNTGVSNAGVYELNTDTKAPTAKLSAIPSSDTTDQYDVRFDIDLADVSSGDKIEILKKGIGYQFGSVGKTIKGQDVIFNDVAVGSLDLTTNKATIVFNENADKYVSGKTYVQFPVNAQNIATGEELLPEGVAFGDTITRTGMDFTVNKFGTDGTKVATSVVSVPNSVQYNYYSTPDYSYRDMASFQIIQNPSQEGRIDFTGGDFSAGRVDTDRKQVHMVFAPRTGEGYLDFNFLSEETLKNNATLKAYVKSETGGRRDEVEIPNGMDYNVALDNQGNLVIDFFNVPAGIQPSVNISKLGVTDYVSPGQFKLQVLERTSTARDGSDVKHPTYSSFGRPVQDIMMAGGEGGEVLTRKPTATVSLPNYSVSQNSPAPVAGTTQEFVLTLGNEGNSSLSAPRVILPDGSRQTFDGVSIAPGGSEQVKVKYAVPENATGVDFKVEYVGASATTTAYVTKKNGADVTVNPDGSITIEGPDGPITLAPQDAVDELEKDLKDANDKVADLQDQLNKEKEKSDADRQRIADLEKELEKAKTDLENTKDALKRAQDAAKAAQDSANNAQETANQALADLARERERVDDLTERADKAEKDLTDARKRVANLEKQNKNQQKQIDEAIADIIALEAETGRLNKELEAAKKRVTALEKENKEQAAAIEALQKENKKQQGEIDGLKKENATQQKQIDGLRKDLTAAEKRISTLETDLAETRKELAAVSERLGVVEDRLNTGIGKCVGTVGGSLLALIPAVALASQVVGGSNIPAIDNAVADVQRQINAFNPELAEVVNQNRGAIAAGFAGLGLLALLLTPGLCGDASIGGAVTEPLSSARDARKAEREAEKATETPAPKSEEATELTENNGEVVEEDVEVVEEDLAPAGA